MASILPQPQCVSNIWQFTDASVPLGLKSYCKHAWKESPQIWHFKQDNFDFLRLEAEIITSSVSACAELGALKSL